MTNGKVTCHTQWCLLRWFLTRREQLRLPSSALQAPLRLFRLEQLWLITNSTNYDRLRLQRISGVRVKVTKSSAIAKNCVTLHVISKCSVTQLKPRTAANIYVVFMHFTSNFFFVSHLDIELLRTVIQSHRLHELLLIYSFINAAYHLHIIILFNGQV